MNIISDKIKIKDLLELKRNSMLTINPEYQRGAVWKDPQQKKLIDSVLRSYPLPLIYLHHKKKLFAGMQREDLEIIDGQQRINALFKFGENAIKLFDPIKDDKIARFPDFIKRIPCPWANCDFISLSEELKERFNNTEIFIVKVTTDNEDEARDLFIRLQAGLPLNAQEKRDAWPGGFTEFTLKFGGKREIDRYPGHDFFRRLIRTPSSDRGEIRTICAQIGMLFFEKATHGNWMDIGTQAVDDYYYRNLGFEINSPDVVRFSKILDVAVEIFQGFKGPKLHVHEAIHIILLLDSLLDDYTRSWRDNFITAFEEFRQRVAIDKSAKSGDYWFQYGIWVGTRSTNAYIIQTRHNFFSGQMILILQPVPKDFIRIYGEVEREIIYYRDNKKCAVCQGEIAWDDLEIHHVKEHQHGGKTILENGVAVHKECHPKGQAAIEFNNNWKLYKKKGSNTIQDLALRLDSEEKPDTISMGNIKEENYKLENLRKDVLAFGKLASTNKFIVLKGSKIAREISDEFERTSSSAFNKRQEFIKDGTINQDFEFTQDVEFSSKSGAASLILGFSANGNVFWISI